MLPSVLYDEQQPGEQPNATMHEVSVPHIENEEGEEPPLTLPLSGIQEARSRPRLASRPLLLSLAAIVSIAAFLVIFSLCNNVSSKTHVSRATLRRLSDDGDGVDNDELSIIEGCLTLEHELGIMRQRAASQSDIDPETRVEGIVSALQAAAAEHERMLRDLEPWPEPTASHTARSRFQGAAHGEWAGLQGAVQPHDEEAVNAYTAVATTTATDQTAFLLTQALDPEAWLENIPYIETQQDGEENPQDGPSIISGSHDGQISRGSHDGQSSTPPLALLRLPAAEGVTHTPPHVPRHIREHPYVRLPVIAKDVFVRRFDVCSLFDPYRGNVQPHFHLLNLRKLFAQKVLGQGDVNALLGATEGLIGAAFYHAQKRRRSNRPVYAAEAFGFYFLAFDAIVSAVELFGDALKVSLWWNRFIRAFDLGMPELRRREQPSAVNRVLSRRLLEALEIYKTCKRPPLKEVIDLKRALFCSPEAPWNFKARKWDPWREDGKHP